MQMTIFLQLNSLCFIGNAQETDTVRLGDKITDIFKGLDHFKQFIACDWISLLVFPSPAGVFVYTPPVFSNVME